MKNVFRKITILGISVLTIFAISKWELIRYGWQQAKGQFKIMYNAEAVENFLKSEQFPDSLKAKILLVQDVKAFAKNTLGFKPDGQYTKIFDQAGKESMWVVTAALPYQMKNYEWRFPILGKVSYKGFFIQEEATKLAAKLKKQGYDVRVRTAGAWSTLGWLNDPLLSNVLGYPEGRLAELILHELTHDEIFIADSIDFNENLASFFGQEFTKLYFQETESHYQEEYEKYLRGLKIRNQLNQYISNYLPKFDSLYHKIEPYSITEKENFKFDFFNQFKSDLNQQDFFVHFNSDYIISNDDFNNAYLLSFKRYSGHQQLLEQEMNLKFGGDPIKMFHSYQDKFNSL